MEIVTAHKGKAHVTAEKMAELNRGIVGAESYVMDGGRQFESELVSNNLLKVYDGSGMMQGRHICIPVGQSDELTIENGNQGMKRIDLVVVRYTKDENTKIENTETIVIKGTPSESAPVVPAHIEGDIRSGDMTVDWPLYEVELDGISVVEVRPLFKVLMNMSEIEKMLTELNGKLEIEKVSVTSEVTLYRQGSLRILQVNDGSTDAEAKFCVLDPKDVPSHYIMFPVTYRGQSDNYFISVNPNNGNVKLFSGKNEQKANSGKYIIGNVSWFVINE